MESAEGRLFVDTRDRDRHIEQLEDRAALRAVIAAVDSGDLVGADARPGGLPGRRGGIEAGSPVTMFFYLNRVADGVDIGIVGAHAFIHNEKPASV